MFHTIIIEIAAIGKYCTKLANSGAFLYNGTMILRNATKNDIDAILTIEHNAFSAEIQESRRTFLERISAFAKGFILLEINGTVQGYLSSELWSTIPDFQNDRAALSLGHSALSSHKKNGTILYISSFAILNSLRGKGIGRAFFAAATERIASEIPILQQALLVNEKWLSARSIYKAEGFHEVGLLKHFFPAENSRSDGIFMTKSCAQEQKNMLIL